MKTRIAALACVLMIGSYGMTPAVAESFNDRGPDWRTVSPMPDAAYSRNPQTSYTYGSGAFASSWGSGRTPSQHWSPASSSTWSDTGRHCDPISEIGFNRSNSFPVC